MHIFCFELGRQIIKTPLFFLLFLNFDFLEKILIDPSIFNPVNTDVPMTSTPSFAPQTPIKGMPEVC